MEKTKFINLGRFTQPMWRSHNCGELRKEHTGKNATLAGWVENIRITGKIGFLLLKDRYGITQCFLDKDQIPLYKEVLKGSVVQVTGKVNARPANQAKQDMATGEVELEVHETSILSKAAPLPLDEAATEDTRLRYRYLDLRRQALQEALKKRHEAVFFIREFLHKKSFLEISTPLLTKSTPEGARDYLVPSRVYPGRFFALPQSPQQYKQLLMVAGMDKYFQIAPCFRDEDARADRSPGEFYQLDLEMSFATQEDILNLTEELFVALVKKVFPEKKIQKIPFPRLDYQEVMRTYGTDKPDLRKNKQDPDELAFCFVTNFPLFEEEKENNQYAPKHHMFTQPHEDDLELLDKNPHHVRSYQHDLVLNGLEIGGGSIRIHDEKLQEKIFDLIGFGKEQKKYFRHMLEAFRYGVPPHGGIAPGIDRSLMAIMGTPSIRDVIAFPKNKEAKDVMMDAPSKVLPGQLDDLHLKIDKK